jgi:two-component system, cell cycle response regulator
MAWFPAELDRVLAVALATVDEQGTLIEANAGFLKLISAEISRSIGTRMARFFIQPTLAALIELRAGADGTVYRGLLTIGDYTGLTRTLRAHVWRTDNSLRLVAEYDIEELERLNDTVLSLNREYAQAQLDLALINHKLQQREAQIVAASLTDPLTGVGNRRRLEQALLAETGRAELTGTKLSVFMADLDHFKMINDDCGHEAGDKVLMAFGDLLRRNTRATDIVARFGGEEFVVLMPNTDLENARAIADRIRAAFSAAPVESLHKRVTASFGVAEMGEGERGDDVLRRADAALYEAKHSGRNRVVTQPDVTVTKFISARSRASG